MTMLTLDSELELLGELILEQLIDDTTITHPQIFDDSILYHGPLIPTESDPD